MPRIIEHEDENDNYCTIYMYDIPCSLDILFVRPDNSMFIQADLKNGTMEYILYRFRQTDCPYDPDTDEPFDIRCVDDDVTTTINCEPFDTEGCVLYTKVEEVNGELIPTNIYKSEAGRFEGTIQGWVHIHHVLKEDKLYIRSVNVTNAKVDVVWI